MERRSNKGETVLGMRACDRYGSDNPKGSVVNSSSSNADSSRQDQASHRYEQYESKQRQARRPTAACRSCTGPLVGGPFVIL